MISSLTLTTNMASPLKFPFYFLVVAVLGVIMTFSHIFNVRSKNTSLARDLKFYQEASALCKEKNKMIVKEAKQNQERQAERIKQLDEQNMLKHNALGALNSKLNLLKREVTSKSKDIKELQRLASNHKEEISNLKYSVLQSKEAFEKLSEKANHLMSNHTQLKQEKHGLQKQNENLQSEVKQHRSQRGNIGEQMNQLLKKNELLGRHVEDLSRKNQVMQQGIQQKIKESYVARDVSVSQKSSTPALGQQEAAPVNRQHLWKLSSQGNDVNKESAQLTRSSDVTTSETLHPAVQRSTTSDQAFERKFSENKPYQQVGMNINSHEATVSKSVAAQKSEGRIQSITDRGEQLVNM